jgi:hypothetical protein
MVEPERAGGALVVARDESLRRLRAKMRMYFAGFLAGMC